MNPGDTICFCKGISREAIVRSIRKGARTLKDIQAATGACTGNRCKELNLKGTCCSADINRLLAEKGGHSGGGSAGQSNCGHNAS